ncbi:MAG: response regulator [Oscillatoriales cyanobacterium SM2_2_1]|nr:response regulator [Oscillatoriales cyanobacterium SM2_2_1]
MPAILIADASLTTREVFYWELSQRSMQGILASNGTTALELFAETLPDLVIANIDLPGVNGFEVCRRIKAEKPEVPVILIACRTGMHTNCLAYKVGASYYANKFSLMEDLDVLLNRLLPDAVRQKTVLGEI